MGRGAFKSKRTLYLRGLREGNKRGRFKPLKRVALGQIFEKKCVNKAELTAMLQTNKSFSLQRLIRDFKEIQNQTIPIPGISAIPLDSNFYVWHGNIKGIASNIYQGMVLHFKFVFPQSYPITPPKIYLLNNDILHPNILSDNSVCLDMLTKEKEPYRGWKSGYSVLSILLQLQSFFFDVEESFLKKHNKVLIKEGLMKANDFKCKECKHKGSANPFPEVFTYQNKPEEFKLTQEQYQAAKLEEIACFHRKTTFKEAPLGLGVSVSKIKRTGEIKGVVPCFEFISLKSFTKEKIRKSLEGDRFTYWFPLYFNHEPEKFLGSCTKAISMLVKGNTKEFNENLILKIMPKFFNNVALNVVAEKTHNSTRALQILIYIFRICLILISKYPSVKDEIDATLENFIKDEKFRTKDQMCSLGDLLVMISLSSKHKITELLSSYLKEQMDRQIFWILQEIPELEKLINSTEIDDIRAKVCFKAGVVGSQLLLFYYYFITNVIYSNCATLEEFVDKLDQNYCSLREQDMDKHRAEIAKILRIDNYADYFRYLGLTHPTDKDLNEQLKQSFVNSLNKGYHGKDEIRFVPNEKEQSELYLKRYPLINSFIKENALLSASDPIWREMISKFDFVVQYYYQRPNETITPSALVHYENMVEYDQMFFSPQSKADCIKESDKLNRNRCAFQYDYQMKRHDDKLLASLNWRQLYLKFYLEDYLKFFNYTTDFKYFYELLDTVKEDIVHLNLKIYGVGRLKSYFNYIRVVLSKLTKLQYLCFTFYEDVNDKVLKNILKGMTSTQDNRIEHLKIVKNPNCLSYSSKDLTILTILDKLPSLRILDLSNLSLNFNDALRIRNHLYYFKKLSSLNLTNCSINDEMAKEIADGIMKAKNLEELYLGKNLMSKDLATILYNLAFQPSIKVIDISGNTLILIDETCTAIHKLLKMSQTLETLICRDMKQINSRYSNDFFYSIGDSNSLVYLDLSNSGILNNIMLLGQAVAFNAVKKGSLRTIKLENILASFNSLIGFINGLEIAENDHVVWYGFQLDSNIKSKSPEYYQKHFYCNLQHLDLSSNCFESSVNILDPKNSYYINMIKSFIEKTKTLEALNLSNCKLNNYFYEMLVDALQNQNSIKYLQLSNSGLNGESTKAFLNVFRGKDKTALNKHFHIIGLDLSLNKFGYSGIEILSKELKTNTTIKYLNLFHNLFDVNGARRLEEALQYNTMLEELDIGYNRIKDLGFTNIMNGIKANKASRVQYLGVKYNYIKDKCFIEQMKALISSPSAYSIKEISLKNNSISEEALTDFYQKEFSKSTQKIITDVFDVLYYCAPDRIERTVWLNCCENVTKRDIYEEIKSQEQMLLVAEKSHLGIPLSIRRIRGKKVGQKKTAVVNNCLVEFISPNSSNRMLKLAGANKFSIKGKHMKVFKCGTRADYIFIKKRNNQKLKERDEMNENYEPDSDSSVSRNLSESS